jgi:hypothetical protein
MFGESIGGGDCSNMTPIGEGSSNLLETAAFPDLLGDCQFDESPIKQTASNKHFGGSPRSSADFRAYAFPDLLSEGSNACDKPSSGTAHQTNRNLFPDLDETQTNVSFSENSEEKHRTDEKERIRLAQEASRAEQAERFKQEQEARIKRAEEAQRCIQESEAKLKAIETKFNQINVEEEDASEADDIRSYGAMHLLDANHEPIREPLPVGEHLSSSSRDENVIYENSNKSQLIQTVFVVNHEKNVETQAIFRKEVDEKIQDMSNPDHDPEMKFVRLDFEPNASFELKLNNSFLGGQEHNVAGENLESLVFETRSIDGSQITNSIMADDDRFDSSKITQYTKQVDFESPRKTRPLTWNNPIRNPHTEYLSRKYDSKRIVDILDSFSINQNITGTIKNNCQDDAWSVGNPIAGISSLISAPRLCDATSKIPYSISFSMDEDEDTHTNYGSIASSSFQTQQEVGGNEKPHISDVSRKPTAKAVVREDIHARIKNKLAKVRSRKQNTYMSSKYVSSETSLDATASLSLSRSTDMHSSINSGSTDPLPVPIAKFDEERPWRKPTIVFHQLHTPNSNPTPISNDLSEDQLIFHLKSRIQNLLAENVPTNIHVDHHKINLDRVERHERMKDNVKDQDLSVNGLLLNSLRAKLRDLECDFGSTRSDKTFGTGKSIDEIKAKLRGLESSHSSGIHDRRVALNP